MNKADTERVCDFLRQAGYQPAASLDEADFVLLNSCVVRESAENKVIGRINSLKSVKKKRPEVIIALTGCLVDSRTEELERRFPWIDLFFPPQELGPLHAWATARGIPLPAEPVSLPSSQPSLTAMIPIIQGCNSFCSYCIVAYRRGREKSRQPDEILCHAQNLIKHGSKEITLLGQNIGAYGRDLPEKTDLARLLALLQEVDGLQRIRFLTNHPKDMDHSLMEAIAHLDKVCEHVSLPVQAGDDRILAQMRRGYTARQYLDTIEEMRSVIPNLSISTDVIVGFPGETDEQFAGTVRVLEQVRFDRVHVAAYSPRPGTLATRKYADDVPPETKQARLQQVEALHERIAAEINAPLLGTTVQVLVEGRHKGKWSGRTRTDKLVFFTHRDDLTGQLVDVKVEKTTAWALQGTCQR